MAMLDQQIEPLDMAVKAEAQRDKMALLLQTQPGVGPITALAYVLTMGDVTRFPRGKQVASYLGLIPREHSSGGRQHLGAISKQGNRMLRMLLVEAATTAVRLDPEFRKEYLHRCHQKPKAVARWRRRASWPYDFTGCCVLSRGIQKSFVSRAARGCAWSVKTRPRMLIGCSRIP
jgi:transposase